VFAIAATPAHAQLNTQHIKGTAGLKSGTQPPPHTYVIAPLVYVYTTDTVKEPNGNTLPVNESLTSAAYAGGVVEVTNRKMSLALVRNGVLYGFLKFNPASMARFAPVVVWC